MQQEVSHSEDEVQVVELEGYESVGRFTKEAVHWWPLKDDATEEGLGWRVSLRGQSVVDNIEDASLHPYVGEELQWGEMAPVPSTVFSVHLMLAKVINSSM